MTKPMYGDEPRSEWLDPDWLTQPKAESSMTTKIPATNGGQILTWQDRLLRDKLSPTHDHTANAMDAEIADLRAALAAPAPVSGMPDSRSLHVATADDPQVDERCQYFWRAGWNAYRTALRALPSPQAPDTTAAPGITPERRAAIHAKVLATIGDFEPMIGPAFTPEPTDQKLYNIAQKHMYEIGGSKSVNYLTFARELLESVAAPLPAAPAPTGLTLTKDQMHAIAKVIAGRVAKNASVAPELCFAPALFALQDAFGEASPLPVEQAGQIQKGHPIYEVLMLGVGTIAAFNMDAGKKYAADVRAALAARQAPESRDAALEEADQACRQVAWIVANEGDTDQEAGANKCRAAVQALKGPAQ